MSPSKMPGYSEIGRSMPRASTRRLVAGRGRYVDDISLKGELHAAFLRSPYANATFVISDVSAALSMDGTRSRGRSVVVLYNGVRRHRSLNKDAPVSRSVQRTGVIRSRAILGGLHHHYGRI
jgi:hypothetical protein